MPRKSKAPTGTVEFVNKPETAPEPSILVPEVAIPQQGTATEAPPAPISPPPVVKGKRPYNKKNGEYWKAVSKDRKGMLMPKPEPKVEPKNEIIMPTPEVVQEAPKKRGRPKKSVAPPPTPVPVPTTPTTPVAPPVKQKKEKKVARVPTPVATPVKAVKVKPVKAKPVKKVVIYESSTEEESDYESEEESDDEAPVEIVAKKAVRRLKTLKKIDERIGQLNNSYSARGYSIF